jgi:predicted ATP-dependent endonuclease of OLD family
VDFYFSKSGVKLIIESAEIKIDIDEMVLLLQAGILVASHIACRPKSIKPAKNAKNAESRETTKSALEEPEKSSKSTAILADTDMSSGQWQLLSSMLSLALTVTDNSLILVDEPENSLHPDWQRSYVQLLGEVIAHRKGCHAVVATHSPLIASGVDGKSGNAIGMKRTKTQAPLGESEALQIAYGWDASDVYYEIFGLSAPRASRFTESADRALELLRDGLVNTGELQELLRELTEVAATLPETDSMRQVVSAMDAAFKTMRSR